MASTDSSLNMVLIFDQLAKIALGASMNCVRQCYFIEMYLLAGVELKEPIVLSMSFAEVEIILFSSAGNLSERT